MAKFKTTKNKIKTEGKSVEQDDTWVVIKEAFDCQQSSSNASKEIQNQLPVMPEPQDTNIKQDDHQMFDLFAE